MSGSTARRDRKNAFMLYYGSVDVEVDSTQ
jgi:hypothetical protein